MTKREMEAKNERAQFEAWLQPSMPRDGQVDEDGDFFYRDDWVQGAWIAWRHLSQRAGAAEPVAVVGADFTLFWAGSGPIAPLVRRHGFKVGSHLYAYPQPASPAAEIFAAGWHLACDWAGREDLHSDEGSPAYEADRAARLAALVQSDKDRAA